MAIMGKMHIHYVMRATNADKREMAEGEGAVRIAEPLARRIKEPRPINEWYPITVEFFEGEKKEQYESDHPEDEVDAPFNNAARTARQALNWRKLVTGVLENAWNIISAFLNLGVPSFVKVDCCRSLR